jgi:putative sugar O-methyltransferase
VLGGFGVRSDDTLYNEDTLQFFRILSLLNDASVLREFRTPAVRPTLWEIGGGWGGFAHCFKTLFPNVTYLISAAPTLLLLSATYLMTLFPTARVRFFEPSNASGFWRDWGNVDFAFAPDTVIRELQPEHLTLTVDIGMLQRMSAPRVAAYVQRAFDLGCRYTLSVCSDDEPQPPSTVRSALQRWYWVHPMAVPGYLERRFGVRNGAFLLGWKRLRT